LIIADGPKLIDMAFSENNAAQHFHLKESEVTLLMTDADLFLSKDIFLEGTLE